MFGVLGCFFRVFGVFRVLGFRVLGCLGLQGFTVKGFYLGCRVFKGFLWYLGFQGLGFSRVCRV